MPASDRQAHVRDLSGCWASADVPTVEKRGVLPIAETWWCCVSPLVPFTPLAAVSAFCVFHGAHQALAHD